MKLVIECLEKELERQNLIIASNERVKQHMIDFPATYEKPLLEEIYPNMVQFRDELETAIAHLKLQINE
jgi:hypothetical protein